MPQEKSSGAIIFRMENGTPCYLLLKYMPSEEGRRGQWGFAKGHIEEGESEEETAKREIFEETGIDDLQITPGFKESEKYFFKRVYGLEGEARKNAPWIFKMVTFFLAETKIKDIKISHEHSDFLWLPFEEALKKITHKNSKELLKLANDFLNAKNRGN